MIVDELIKIQRQKGLTDSQLAESLGIHKISWYRNKRTKLISAEILLRAFDVYPEFREKWLSSFAGKKDSTDPSDASQDGKLARFRVWLRGLVKR